MKAKNESIRKIAHVLAKRDGLSLSEAMEITKDTVETCLVMIESGRSWEAEEFWMEDMGLEVDYLQDLILEVI